MIEDFYKPGIIIQRVTNTNDAGAISEVWNTHLIISAHIRSLASNERVFTDKETVFATHRMYCADADIIEADSVLDGSLTYQIKGISKKLDKDNVTRHMEIDLLVDPIVRT